MNTQKIFKWLPIITYLFITPCGSHTFCVPLLITLPIGLFAGDFNGILPLIGLVLIIYANTASISKNKILFIIGALILIVTIFKLIYYDFTTKNYDYVWDSAITYITLFLFIMCSLISIYVVFNVKSKTVKA
ncbi:hypothetical protein GCM10028773_03140 [Spirosoma koreense]